MSEKSTNDESHEVQDEQSKENNEGSDNQQSITMVEIAQWYEFLDTSSNKYYYHNYATGETNWEKPISTSSSKIIQIVPYQVSQSESATYGQSSDSLSNTYAALSSTVTSVLPQSLLTTPGQGDYTATAYFNQSSGRFGGTGNNYWEEVSFVFDLFLFLILCFFHISLFLCPIMLLERNSCRSFSTSNVTIS
jgi:hypothetical protein